MFLTHEQCGTWAMGHGQWYGMLVNTADRDGGPWGWVGGWGTCAIGHMGNRAHGYNFLNTAWIFIKILLDIDIDGFSSNIV